ncbi:hypothetical protein [Hydrocarboniphaga effusa]|jgi:hypothetical protein|uniref:hypothetical protein n=1 Tax=Hydrocarboniphaga effusa TaxID=243629 RepID=UPI002AB9E649|nr:hypothetical protein [Polynucleobacter sp.]
MSAALLRWRPRWLDAAESSVLLSRAVNVMLGPVITLAIGIFFSPELQGYYYFFASIVAAANFFEAGVSTAIIQFAAHEAGKLKLDFHGHISGPEQAQQRLAATFRFAVKWFWSAAAIATFCIGGLGWTFLAGRDDQVDWMLPFIVLVLSLGLNFAIQPFFVFLEGAGKVAYVYRGRTASALVATTARLGMVMAGADLIAISLSSIIAVIVGLLFLLPAKKLFSSILKINSQGALDWKSEVWPFQSKIALSWMAGYFTVAMFTPVLMAVAGPVQAGQIGMTVALLNGCTALAASFIQAHAPALGGYAGAGQWKELNRLFFVKAKRSIGGGATLISAVTLFFVVLQLFRVPIADRVVGAGAFVLLALGFFAYHCEGVLAFYVRAQKREPYFMLEILGAIVIFPCTFFLGRAWGAWGVSMGFAAAHLLLLLPMALWILKQNQKGSFFSAPC